MFTSQITKVIDHPDEPGVSFTLRKLSWAHCEEAAQVKLDKLFAMMKSLQGIELPNDPNVEAQAKDPLTKYDRATVLRHGITAWSYDTPLGTDSINDLDESTAAWLFSAIVVHSLRSADEGEASGSDSTAISA